MANFGVSHTLQNGVTISINDLLNRILRLEKLVQSKGSSLPSNFEVKPILSGEEFNSLLKNNENFKFFREAVEELGKKDLERIEESKKYTKLMVENSNDIKNIKLRLESILQKNDK